jgi:Fic family protein
MTAIPYHPPANWLKYDPIRLTQELTEAKATVIALQTVPFQRRWVESLQRIELKREVAGTSRIEGAEFTESELNAAIDDSATDLVTRSQRQARAAVETYRWIAKIPHHLPIDVALIAEIHRRIVTDADDDHCPPGELRGPDQNVVFGSPRHRGVEGGEDCRHAFSAFAEAIQGEYRAHDPLVQAIAAHYHLAAMHPFLDGNGRTARALEALMLQRAGLRDTTFLAMSNYYYDEKIAYLNTLAQVRREDHNLTPFLSFALKGVTQQARRLLAAIQKEIQKELYEKLAVDLYDHLKTPKKRVIAERQLAIIRVLLSAEQLEWPKLIEVTRHYYAGLKNPVRALVRDVNSLGWQGLGAIKIERAADGVGVVFSPELDWPTRITESDFLRKLQELPKAKTALVPALPPPVSAG